IGPDMSVFPTPKHLASWAGQCPGNDRSAGKRRSGRTRKGSRWLGIALTEAALAATRTKNTYLAAQYQRLRPRRGHQRALRSLGDLAAIPRHAALRVPADGGHESAVALTRGDEAPALVALDDLVASRVGGQTDGLQLDVVLIRPERRHRVVGDPLVLGGQQV